MAGHQRGRQLAARPNVPARRARVKVGVDQSGHEVAAAALHLEGILNPRRDRRNLANLAILCHHVSRIAHILAMTVKHERIREYDDHVNVRPARSSC